MPPKVRDLIKKLKAAGFVDRGGRGSHRNLKHPRGVRITMSGGLNDDAKPYQERAVEQAVEDVKQ
jgi:predicted RNA binding protein YcfA (HicA-like mRNA interferase family)